ncbi:MAG: NAD(P)/FAD-dependent oxidoreductase [Burkholderiales bacterium]
MSESPSPRRCDVVVVGAGLAGAATSTVLARRGLKVILVDPYPEFPPLFRAEKLEPSQAALLRKLGLFEGVQPGTRLIREIIHGRGGRIVRRRAIEQFGISYRDIVNRVRAQIPPGVELLPTRVESVASDARHPAVVLAEGERIEARLVVIATGMSSNLPERLGVVKAIVKGNLSMVFGFMLERNDGQDFAFDAVTYRPDSPADKVGYLTLFRMGQYMRGNLFSYVEPRDALVREMRREPVNELRRVLPGLERVVGPFAVSGKVEVFNIDLYRMRDCARPGVVLLGDAYQSVCPSTGMGLTKVLTDVDVLCNALLGEWLAGDAVEAAHVASFYTHPAKVAVDDLALRAALSGRDCVVDGRLHWRLRRRIRDWRFATGW